MSDIVRHFNREAAAYPMDVGTDYVQFRKWELIRAYAADDALAADIGAASGRHAIALAQAGGRVVAVDPSRKMLLALMKAADGASVSGAIRACCGSLPALPLKHGLFDVVFCFSTLLLLPRDAQETAIGELAALLKPDGHLILDIANARCTGIHYWRRYYRRRGMAGVFGHAHSEIAPILVRQGLDVVSREAYGALSQFLLMPGLGHIDALVRKVCGGPSVPGWDAILSRQIPSLAERWYVVARPRDDRTV